MSAEEATLAEQEPRWPYELELDWFLTLNPDDVVGERRMGTGLAFADAGTQVSVIASVLDELALDWDRLGSTRQGEIGAHIATAKATVEAMLRMDSSHIDVEQDEVPPVEVRTHRDNLAATLNGEYAYFADEVRPLCITQRAREAARDVLHSEGGITDERVADLIRQFQALRQDADEFRELRPVVEQQRELLGKSGTAKLSGDFEDRARNYASSWKRWLGALLVWVGVVGGLGSWFLYKTRPDDDASNAQIASHALLSLLVVGLALYVIRVLSTQYRASRHMEIVLRNKASALSTFNRITTGMPEDVQVAVASALAKAVFASDERIFADGTAEQVTLFEQVVQQGVQRARAPSS
jgi:hypothetical protein